MSFDLQELRDPNYRLIQHVYTNDTDMYLYKYDNILYNTQVNEVNVAYLKIIHIPSYYIQHCSFHSFHPEITIINAVPRFVDSSGSQVTSPAASSHPIL